MIVQSSDHCIWQDLPDTHSGRCTLDVAWKGFTDSASFRQQKQQHPKTLRLFEALRGIQSQKMPTVCVLSPMSTGLACFNVHANDCRVTLQLA